MEHLIEALKEAKDLVEELKSLVNELKAISPAKKEVDAEKPKAETVDFHGVNVKKKNGVFFCPFHCTGNNGYPEQKWKTAEGFLKHRCTKVPKNT